MIQRILLFSGLGFIFILLETTLLPYISVRGIVPALNFLVLVYLAFQYGSFEGVMVGFVLGIMYDQSRLGVLGFQALIYVVFSYFLGLFRGKVQFDLILIPFIVFVASGLAKFFLTSIFAFILGIPGVFSPTYLWSSLVEFLYTLILLFPIFYVLKFLDKILLSKKIYT